MVRYAARQPKVKSTTKKPRKKYAGRYFGRVRTQIIDERLKQQDTYKWSGFLSPSNNLTWDMCMDRVYDEMCVASDIDDAGAFLGFNGSALHKAFEKASLRVPDFHYPFKHRQKPELMDWQNKSYPEAVGQCDVSGWKYKADSILRIVEEKRFGHVSYYDDENEGPSYYCQDCHSGYVLNHCSRMQCGEMHKVYSDKIYPDLVCLRCGKAPGAAVFDLKSIQTVTATKWEEACLRYPREKDFLQLCVYGDRIEASGLVPRVDEIGLGYFNASNHLLVQGQLQEKEFWYPRTERIRYDTSLFVYRVAQHRRWHLLGERYMCNYEYCRKHGTSENKIMEYISQFKQEDVEE